MRRDQFAIFSAPDGSYVQCIWSEEPDHLWCEAVDFDKWESGDRSMTDEIRARLEAMNWERADDGNYWVEEPAYDATTIHRLAGFLARTLHDAYGVPATAPLKVVVDS